MSSFLTGVRAALRDDAARASLAGRVWCRSWRGPSVVAVRDGTAVDISGAFPTMRDLCEAADPATAVRDAPGEAIGSVDALLANTPVESRDGGRPWLLAALDLQAVKGAGGDIHGLDAGACDRGTCPGRYAGGGGDPRGGDASGRG